MDPSIWLTSAVVAAVVSGLVSYLRERQILDRKAEVDYRSNAKKRLYDAIGPLRLQLLLANRDLVHRITRHVAVVERGGGWNMSAGAYYVQSFVYRVLRPIAIGQLIRRQMSIADFAVDKDARDLLRFDGAADQMLTGGEIVLGHERADWNRQTDHLFSDNLQVAAASLFVAEPGQPVRVADFAEFVAAIEPGVQPALDDLFLIFGACKQSLLENPIFWLRLVGYGYLCNSLIDVQGRALGFRARPYDAAALLRPVQDATISSSPERYVAAFQSVAEQGL